MCFITIILKPLHSFHLILTHFMCSKYCIPILMKIFIVTPYYDTTYFPCVFPHTRFFNFRNILDRTLFERGNVLKLSSHRPNNKKKIMKPMMAGGAAKLKFSKSAPGLVNAAKFSGRSAVFMVFVWVWRGISWHGPHGIRATQGWRRGVSGGWNCDLPTGRARARHCNGRGRSAGYTPQHRMYITSELRCIENDANTKEHLQCNVNETVGIIKTVLLLT